MKNTMLKYILCDAQLLMHFGTFGNQAKRHHTPPPEDQTVLTSNRVSRYQRLHEFSEPCMALSHPKLRPRLSDFHFTNSMNRLISASGYPSLKNLRTLGLKVGATS